MSSSSAKKFKIFVIFQSTSGHINPVSGLVSELCKRPDVECVFYGNVENREIIEKIGAQFRLYSHRNMADLKHSQITRKGFSLQNYFYTLIDCSYALLPQLLRDVHQERPDLILYGTRFLPARYLLEILKKENEKEIKSVMFFPSFILDSEVMSKSSSMNKGWLWYVYDLKFFFHS